MKNPGLLSAGAVPGTLLPESPLSLPQKRFYGLLALVTAIPFLGLSLGAYFSDVDHARTLSELRMVIAITSTGHVMATLFFYFEKGSLRDLINAHPFRFIWSPLVMIAFGVLFIRLPATSLLPMVSRWSIVSYFAWQLYHYQRQNFGLIAFAANSTEFGTLPPSINWMLHLAMVAGVCAAAPVDLSTVNLDVLQLVHQCAYAFYGAATIALAYILMSAPALRRNWLVLGFTLMSWGFFLPALLSHNILIAFYSYAVAHGGQYLLIMGVFAGNDKNARRRLTLLLGCVAFGMILVSKTGTVGESIAAGTAMAHFIIDAKVWRMREPLQRRIIRARFAFLFPVRA